jgi:hypothetical protein
MRTQDPKPCAVYSCADAVIRGLALSTTRVVLSTQSHVLVCTHDGRTVFQYAPNIRIEAIAVGRIESLDTDAAWHRRAWQWLAHPAGDQLFVGGSAGEILSLDIARRESWSAIVMCDGAPLGLRGALASVKPATDFYIALLSLVLQALQTAAFAFDGAPVPASFESTQAALSALQRFSTGVPLRLIAAFGMSVAACAAFFGGFFTLGRLHRHIFYNLALRARGASGSLLACIQVCFVVSHFFQSSARCCLRQCPALRRRAPGQQRTGLST